MAEHVPLVIDDVGVPAGDVVGMLHLRVHVYRTDVRSDHVDVVEMRVRPVLQEPGSARLHPDLGHRHGLAWPVDDLGPVESKRAHGLGVLAVGTAYCADVADIVGAKHGVDRLDPVAEGPTPAALTVVRNTAPPTAPK